MGKNTDKNVSQILSGKYSQKLLDHVKQSAIDALRTTSKRVMWKTAETTGDLIGNKIADRIMKVSKPLPQSDLETVTNEHYKEIPKERNVFTEERHQMIDELRLTL